MSSRHEPSARALGIGIRAALLIGASLCELALLHWIDVAIGTRWLDPTKSSVGLVGLAVGNAIWAASTLPRKGKTPSLMVGRAFLAKTIASVACGGCLVLTWAAAAVLHTAAGASSAALDSIALWGAETGGVATGGAAIGVTAACLLYAVTIGQRRVSIESVELSVPGWPAALAEMTIAHISDLHIGANVPPAALAALLERVQRLSADLIVITGDIFDYDPAYIEEGCRELAKLSAPCGVYAILGNHDVYTGADRVAHGIAQLTSIRVLRDASTAIEVGGVELHLIGIEDSGRELSARDIESEALTGLSAKLPRGAASIVLVHRPNLLRQLARLRLPVALAGHTHGGQITAPWPLAHVNVARLTAEWTRGRFVAGDTQLYVNRGLGVGGIPIRFNCPREIAVVRIRPGEIERTGARAVR